MSFQGTVLVGCSQISSYPWLRQGLMQRAFFRSAAARQQEADTGQQHTLQE